MWSDPLPYVVEDFLIAKERGKKANRNNQLNKEKRIFFKKLQIFLKK